MKAYQYSSHNTQEAYSKLCRSKDKLDAMKQSAKANARRKEQLESKEGEVSEVMCIYVCTLLIYSDSNNTKRISKDR